MKLAEHLDEGEYLDMFYDIVFEVVVEFISAFTPKLIIVCIWGLLSKISKFLGLEFESKKSKVESIESTVVCVNCKNIIAGYR